MISRAFMDDINQKAAIIFVETKGRLNSSIAII